MQSTDGPYRPFSITKEHKSPELLKPLFLLPIMDALLISHCKNEDLKLEMFCLTEFDREIRHHPCYDDVLETMDCCLLETFTTLVLVTSV